MIRVDKRCNIQWIFKVQSWGKNHVVKLSFVNVFVQKPRDKLSVVFNRKSMGRGRCVNGSLPA